MMDFEEFKKEVTDGILDFLPDELAKGNVTLNDVTKNNGLHLSGLTIKQPDVNISPTIYLENYYEQYKDGRDFGAIMTDIALTYAANVQNRDFDADAFRDFSQVRDKVVFKIVNKEANADRLENMPYKEVGDLAKIYMVKISKEAHVDITNSLTEAYGVTPAELDSLADKNTPELLPVEFKPMLNIIDEIMGGEPQETGDMFDIGEPDDHGMYVLSNQDRMSGAGAILYPGVEDKIREALGKDFYILPSSVHELIILPKSDDVDVDYLREIINEVNTTQVSPDEVLSGNVYEMKDHELVIAEPENSKELDAVLREDSGEYSTVMTNIGEMPLNDFREIQAHQYGFDSYADMEKACHDLALNDYPGMDYKISVTEVKDNEKLLGRASVTFNDSFKVTGIQIRMNTKTHKPFVQMPNFKYKEEYLDICNPVTKEFREELYSNIMKAYESEEKSTEVNGRYSKGAMPGIETKVFIKDPQHEGKAVANAQIVLGGVFAVNSIKLYENDKGGIFPSMPSYMVKGEDGKNEFREICHPTKNAMKQAIDSRLNDAYAGAVEKLSLKNKISEKASEIKAPEKADPALAKDKGIAV